MPNLSSKQLQKLNKTQIFVLKQICRILFDCNDVYEFIRNERVNYRKIKDTLYAKHLDDSHLKVWDLVAKHYSGERVMLNETKMLSLPIAFDSVVCFHQKEFKEC